MDNQIFVSSTCFDLIDLRAELKEFIELIGLKPIMSDQAETEFRTFHNENSIETCLINLRQSNTVVIILSQRYGPSLKDAGFEDFSATHLEYLEAAKNDDIKIIMFVRDRLEADYLNFKKNNDANRLSWIKDKDIRLFEIIEAHKKLENANRNNWYWTFKTSIDLKQRLKIELENEIKEHRLNELINKGFSALLTIRASAEKTTDPEKIKVNLKIINLGSQPAIEPILVLFKANSYEEVIASNLDKSILDYELRYFSSLRASEESENIEFKVLVTDHNQVNLVVENIYKTPFGDWVSDISELVIIMNISEDFICYPKHTTKRYINQLAYNKLTK